MTETWLVLGVSLGASAVWAVLSILRKLSQPGGLADQTTAMNTPFVDSPTWDLVYQLTSIVLVLVPVALALHLLGRDVAHPARVIGFDRARPGFDLALGTGLTAAIGIPGLALYLVAREIGLNTTVAAANLDAYWWTVPVLILLAIKNAVLEEVLMVGYLLTRWGQAGWRKWTAIGLSALIRGAYHLYQGFGGFVGNIIMGVVFGWLFTRTRRTMPLVVAHTLLDVVAFVGYALVAPRVGWL